FVVMDVESDIDEIEGKEEKSLLTNPFVVSSHKKQLKKSELKANKLTENYSGIIPS
ncbi:unnamed protein product, partial [Didymodactylos carnosus]